eukprot:2876664-Amphidinium_carterae.1
MTGKRVANAPPGLGGEVEAKARRTEERYYSYHIEQHVVMLQAVGKQVILRVHWKGDCRSGDPFWSKNAVPKMPCFAVFHENGGAKIPRFVVFSKSEVHETGVLSTFWE